MGQSPNKINTGFAALGAPHPSSPTRRGGAKQIEAQRLDGLLGFFSLQGLTGAGLPTALHEKSPAQSAELQFVCGERGTTSFEMLRFQEKPKTHDFGILAPIVPQKMTRYNII